MIAVTAVYIIVLTLEIYSVSLFEPKTYLQSFHLLCVVTQPRVFECVANFTRHHLVYKYKHRVSGDPASSASPSMIPRPGL